MSKSLRLLLVGIAVKTIDPETGKTIGSKTSCVALHTQHTETHTMASFFSHAQTFGVMAVACLILLAASALPAYSQQKPPDNTAPAAEQKQDNQSDKTGMEEEEVAHPFFTHMGVPEGVGVYNLRLAGLATRTGGHTDGDFAFHFETGLTKFIGLHIRNDRFLTNTRTEAMVQFAAVRSKNGMSGFSPIIEFEFPTRSGGGKRVNTLVGFSTALANSRVSFNQVLHYNPREDMVDASAALVFKARAGVYPVMEVLTEAARGETPIISLLLGLKVRVNKNMLLGFAFQVPTTRRKDFASQMVFQPDIEWRRTQ